LQTKDTFLNMQLHALIVKARRRCSMCSVSVGVCM
jgi:hypothetical protein